MTDWQKGDLALCVDDGLKPWLNGEQILNLNRIKKGRVYTVAGLGRVGTCSGLTLFIEGVPATYEHRGMGWTASRFRKVTPPKADEFDREVIDLMNRKPVEA